MIYLRIVKIFPWLLLSLVLCVAQEGLAAKKKKYDLVYTWDTNIENVLDYMDRLEELFDSDVSRQLKIVGRGNEYGIICDTNEVANVIIQDLAKHGEILRNAGLDEAWAIADEGYYELYNVSYGLGPNVEALKKTYHKIYQRLGKDVGKDLFIERTSANNYTLIYRRRGDSASTNKIAVKHAKLLRGTGVRTSLTRESNNEVVYGESSLLDDSAPSMAEESAGKKSETREVATTGTAAPIPPPVDKSDKKKDDAREVAKAETPANDGSNEARKPQEKKSVPVPAARPVVNTAGMTDVERNIEDLISKYRKKGMLRGDERTGWMVYDLESDTSIVDINADLMFQAASMIKPFVALAFFHQVDSGKLKYGTEARSKMEAMIQRSSNTATNWVMRQVGGPASCQSILRTHYSSIFKKTVINEYIPAGGKTYKNSAAPSDYIRFLRALWNDRLPHGKEMRRVMALPGRDRLYHGTAIPQGTLVYNKTGSTAHLIGDMGILVPKTVNGAGHPYAIVGIIERSSRASNYSGWMVSRGNVIREVSTWVYKELTKKYHLR